MRPYTAAQVVSKRGTVAQQYLSDLLAKKLWTILEQKAKRGDTSHTYGALDPVQVTQMAKYLETVYVSGWQSSSTASSTNEPGPDLADVGDTLFRFRAFCLIHYTVPIRHCPSQGRASLPGTALP